MPRRSVAADFDMQRWTATTSQTVFDIRSGLLTVLSTATYDIGANSLEVYVGGSKKIIGVDYTETNNHTFTFGTGLSAGQVVEAKWIQSIAPVMPFIPLTEKGIESINVETLAADKILSATDATRQFLILNGVTRNVGFPTNCPVGKMFIITPVGTDGSQVYIGLAPNYDLDVISTGATKAYLWDGTNWRTADTSGATDNISMGQWADGSVSGIAIGATAGAWNEGSSIGHGSEAHDYGATIGKDSSGSTKGAAVGWNANALNNGVSVGYNTNGSNYAVAIGSEASSTQNGVAIGYKAIGNYQSVAIGYQASANNQYYAFVKGFNSKAERYGEETKSSDSAAPTKYSYSTLAWHGQTTTATQTELFLGGYNNQRCTVLASSAFGFSIYCTAMDSTYAKAKRWKIEGLIKRDASNATAIVGPVTRTVITQTDTSGGTDNWLVDVVADDTNDALVVKVTGAASTTIKWVCRGEIEEVRF